VDRFGETHKGFLIHGWLASFPASILAAGKCLRGAANLTDHSGDCQGKKAQTRHGNYSPLLIIPDRDNYLNLQQGGLQ
jgi:hypothetical protein